MSAANLPDPDRELAKQAIHDPQAFAELYRLHVQGVYRFHLARTGLPAEAEDLTADTFFAALEGMKSFQGRGSFAAWLFGIARRKQALHFRQHVHWDPLEKAERIVDATPSPETQVSHRLQLVEVSCALQAISSERAEALALCFFAGLDTEQTALVMDKSESAVKMLVSRGLQDLRRRFAFASEDL